VKSPHFVREGVLLVRGVVKTVFFTGVVKTRVSPLPTNNKVKPDFEVFSKPALFTRETTENVLSAPSRLLFTYNRLLLLFVTAVPNIKLFAKGG
jgi:hypothetical protein